MGLIITLVAFVGLADDYCLDSGLSVVSCSGGKLYPQHSPSMLLAHFVRDACSHWTDRIRLLA